MAVYLDSLSVSRHHARIVCAHGAYFVEDLGSSNGTYVNGVRVNGRVPLTEHDELHIGPYIFHLHRPDRPTPPRRRTRHPRPRGRHGRRTTTLFSQNAAYKLQVVLAIARDLGRTLELDPVLGRLLDHLLRLFPQADRGMAVLCEGDRLRASAPSAPRQAGAHGDFPYSRSIVRKALDEGVGLLSEDVARRRQARADGHAGFAQFAVVFVRTADRLGGPAPRRHPAGLPAPGPGVQGARTWKC